MKQKSYPFSTEGFEACMADIRAEQSRHTINRNVTATLVFMLIAMAAISTGGSSLTFSHTVYELIPAIPMPMIP